ncbi:MULTISPECIES: GPP34 family phosphoprotein [unclassified Streptomyces]|uniref:GOLPH3/VPS74 family protein n=1 Tax=Streptomyces TaxID=1883 RepID=UPI0003727126|nr:MULTISPECIES: GPP34 family phosphoprotein [unclassified Streptomyces]AWN27980.1 GPP34 family phosphoprotein [Streptomyces sp. NEAU-S7GS2]MYT15553.1 GPP34 family phosphoprotein [Streptomyces sp. SID4951]MYX06427.1 GPP34 family phosphoprotein [Streptomyces sp. SID8375]SCK22698.1 Golgi phosphoprotein 3 (GPP34) [Streptomyces sp. SceaMP-e96]
MTGTPLTLPEELLLLALEPERGRFLNHARYLRYGLAGAALADLEEAGRITVGSGDRITVTNPLPLGDPVLDGALAALPGPDKRGRGIKAERWVRRAGRPVQELCVRRLEERGALRRETRRALGLFPYARFPAGAVDLVGPARERFAAALGAGFPDRRGRLMAALASATDLDRRLLLSRGYRPVRREMKRFAREFWMTHAVQRAVRQDKEAASHAASP